MKKNVSVQLRLKVAAALVVFVASGASSGAFAQYVVNEPLDQRDFDLSDGVCVVCLAFDGDGNCTTFGGCTLVAAIQNANLSPDVNDISFSVPVVQNPTTRMPEINFPVRNTHLVPLRQQGEDRAQVVAGHGVFKRQHLPLAGPRQPGRGRGRQEPEAQGPAAEPGQTLPETG